MSQQNVEIIRRGLEAFQRGNVEEAVAMLDPAVVWKQLEEPEAAGRDRRCRRRPRAVD
jgi:ketosteroid isomerase-like protein